MAGNYLLKNLLTESNIRFLTLFINIYVLQIVPLRRKNILLIRQDNYEASIYVHFDILYIILQTQNLNLQKILNQCIILFQTIQGGPKKSL